MTGLYISELETVGLQGFLDCVLWVLGPATRARQPAGSQLDLSTVLVGIKMASGQLSLLPLPGHCVE